MHKLRRHLINLGTSHTLYCHLLEKFRLLGYLYKYILSVTSCIYDIFDSVTGIVTCYFIISQSGMATV